MINLQTLSKLNIKNTAKPVLKQSTEFKNADILLQYQKDWINNTRKHRVSIWEKSRRIGASWIDACLSVLNAIKKGTDTYYISYNFSMTEQYIHDAAEWAKKFNMIVSSVKKRILKDEDKDILVYRIRFSNGSKIVALSSKPKSLRSKQGDVVLDEAAFHDDFNGVMKAALALLMWGGSVRVLSTHNTKYSEFNKLVEDVVGGEYPSYYHQKTTFRDAIADGLYKKTCIKLNETWTLEKEFAYVAQMYLDYGRAASEELDVIPGGDLENQVLKVDLIVRDEASSPRFLKEVIAIDFAATDKDTSCYTALVHLGYSMGKYWIIDYKYCKKNASETQAFVVEYIKTKSQTIPIFVELEGGSQSILWLENSFKDVLKGYRVTGINPRGSKLMRALPIADSLEAGEYMTCLSQKRFEHFKDKLEQFDGTPGVPIVTDLADAWSLAHDQIRIKFNSLIGLDIQKNEKTTNHR
jgi:phage terminase large subunit-like protein